MRLADRIALITGAGSGIGRETALLFAVEGARVVVVDRDEAAGAETVALVGERCGDPGRAVFARADVSRDEDCRAMVEVAETRFGALHVLFNNAGILDGADGDAISTPEAVWD